ncbi:hypothetical protein CPB86DRAFT_763883 [Serendipita vermifera]|nr:hypothetical protein CPB86DRAFT_763883 [Serendipita vermifera]
MTNRNENETDSRENQINVESDDEHNVDESTALLNQQDRVDGSNNAEVSKNDDQHRRWANFLNWSKRDLGYAFLFSVPLLLLVPSIVLFVVTMNLRATLPPSSSLETINNLTHRVDRLSKSLATCNANSTHLAILLHDEEQRVAICRESEKRLAERVDIVEGMLETCKSHEATLKEELEHAEDGLNSCIDEKEELKKQMESGVFVQFLDMVGKMGTGGDSWVCSDLTKSWSYGYSSTESPHSTITIQTWTAALNDVQHSAAPLVFPPTTDNTQPSTPDPAEAARLDYRIIGYTVTSQNTSGSNGWWRIAQLPKFGMLGRAIEFYAQAAKWYGSTAKFEVTVYWVGNS